jgi:hypothetical protein
MSKMPCEKHLRRRKAKKTEASAWKLPKISPSNKKKYVRGMEKLTIFETGPSRS